MGLLAMLTFVVYDVVSDKVRQKVADACLDYGLERVQYSTFRGDLTANRRQELALRLKERLGEKEGCIHVIPVCEKDAAAVAEMGKVLAERPSTIKEGT